MIVLKVKKLVGYTLVELLVTLSILALMASVVVPGLKPYNQRTLLFQSAETAKAAILEARTYALSPRGLPGLSPISYKAVFQKPNGFEIIELVELSSNPVENRLEQGSFPEGISIGVSSPNRLEIEFSADGGGRLLRPIGGTEFSLSGFGEEKKILIFEQGNVEIR